jgi:hypothetical protein
MTLPSQTAPSTLLSPGSYAVVSATAPVVAQHADEITARFYANMFAAHPELLRVSIRETRLLASRARRSPARWSRTPFS